MKHLLLVILCIVSYQFVNLQEAARHEDATQPTSTGSSPDINTVDPPKQDSNDPPDDKATVIHMPPFDEVKDEYVLGTDDEVEKEKYDISAPCLPEENPLFQYAKDQLKTDNQPDLPSQVKSENIPEGEGQKKLDEGDQSNKEVEKDEQEEGEVKQQGDGQKEEKNDTVQDQEPGEIQPDGATPSKEPATNEQVLQDLPKDIPSTVQSQHPAEPPLEPSAPEGKEVKAASPGDSPETPTASLGEVKEGGEEGGKKDLDPSDTKDTDEKDAAKKTDEMPSFDEWKQQKLKEEAEKEKNKQQEVHSSHATTIQNNKAKSKNRVNFAAANCGAKVLASNSESQNAASILTENKDKYMIQPCKAKKWFTLELCEPIQVSTLELGNLEFFSSQPQSFIMQISDRFPTKDWKALGTFHARDERTIQSFAVNDETYAKYVRIEITSHYGEEHYCPLTVVRVFGTTVHEEEEEDQEDVPVETSEDEVLLQPPETAENEKSSSLIGQAIETAQTLIKDVLSPGEKEQKAKEEELEEVVQMQPLNDTNKTEPCTPDAKTTGEPGKGKQAINPDQPATPNATIPSQDSLPITTTTPAPLVRLIETPSDAPPLSTIGALLASCQFCSTESDRSCYANKQSVCGYYRILKYVYPTTCALVSTKYTDSVEPMMVEDLPAQNEALDLRDVPVVGEDADKVIVEKGTITSSVVEDFDQGVKEEKKIEATEQKQKDDVTKHQDAPKQQQTEKLSVVPTKVQSTPYLKPAETKLTQAAKKVPLSVIDKGTIKPTKTMSQEHKTQAIQLEASGKAAPDSAVKKDQETTKLDIKQAPVSEESDGKIVNTEDISVASSTQSSSTVSCDSEQAVPSEGSSDGCQMGPDIVQIRPSSTEEIKEATAQPTEPIKEEEPKNVKSSQEKEPGSESLKQKTEQQVNGQQKQQNGGSGNHIYAEASNGIDDLGLESVPPPSGDADDEIQIMKKPTAKETTYMKLRNRIKDLERNLNFSSSYLEELSQRYKKQMEKMYSSLNKTIDALKETSESAEARDSVQQSKIESLQGEVHRLNFSLSSLTQQFDGVHQQMMERHLYLMLVEMGIFLCILAWVLHRQQQIPPHLLQQLQQQQRQQQQQQPSTSANIVTLGPSSLPAKDNPKAKNHKKPSSLTSLARKKLSVTTSPPRPSPSVSTLTFGHKTPQNGAVGGTVKRGHRRRNSSDGTPSRLSFSSTSLQERRSRDDMALIEKTDNECDLTIVEQNLPLFIFDDEPIKPMENHKKKKKKQKAVKGQASTSATAGSKIDPVVSKKSHEHTNSAPINSKHKPKMNIIGPRRSLQHQYIGLNGKSSNVHGNENLTYGVTNGFTNGFHDSDEDVNDFKNKSKLNGILDDDSSQKTKGHKKTGSGSSTGSAGSANSWVFWKKRQL